MNPPSRIGKAFAVLTLLAAVFFFAVWPVSVLQASGSVSVNAGFVDPSVDAGQTAEYHIEITNGNTVHPPPEPKVDGLTFTYAGRNQSQQLTINNFQPQYIVTTIYVYTVETGHPGRYVVPGQQIDVDGTSLRTPQSLLTVLDAGAGVTADAPGRMLSDELIVPKTSAYVGESFPAELRVYFGLQVVIKQIEPDPQIEGEGFSAQKFTQPRIQTQEVNGAQARVVTYKTAITGAKIGNLVIGPVTVQPAVQLPTQQKRRRGGGMFDDPMFDDPFNNMFNMSPIKQVKLRTGIANVEIKSLPPGKPADFSGAIGDFKLEAEADPRKAQTGDPVTVRLVLSGRGNFDRIAAPVLTSEKGLRTYPATSKFKADDDVGLSGIKTFEQVVVPDGPRTSLPPYHFSYLDPSTGKYATLDTPPIPVEIIGGSTPAPTVNATPLAASSSTTPTATPTPTLPPKPAEDILYIRTDLGPSRAASDFLPPYRRRAFWEVQGGVLVCLLAVGGVGGMVARARNEKARRQAQLLRRQAELQCALQREDTGRGDFYSAATQLARLKAAMVGQPAGSLSVADICRSKGLDARVADSMEEIFHRHDELAYSGGRKAQEPVPAEERRGVLATLESLERF